MPFMIDSCVYIDVFTQDKVWFSWSLDALENAAVSTNVIINPVIFSEISGRFKQIEDIDSRLPPNIFLYHPIPKEAAFLAGKCFLKYRKQGGTRTVTLPDFFIGAHAAVANVPLITRDPKRFRHYFPELKIIAP